MRFAFPLLLLIAAAPIPAAATTPNNTIRGVWTHLLIEGRPDEPRRLPVIYQDEKMAHEEELRRVASASAERGFPVVLNIEHHPLDNAERWWLTHDRDSPEVFASAQAYMVDRLAIARHAGATAALWSRPSQNGLLHVWKNGHTKLKREYDERWDEAAQVLPFQDFVAIQLYLPQQHRPYVEKGWPLDQWKRRGDWFVNHARQRGKPAMVFLSPTYGGASGEYVPADWLLDATAHFAEDGGSVCVWGGIGKTWKPAHPMCQALQRVITESARNGSP